jgi:hypothetical protein
MHSSKERKFHGVALKNAPFLQNQNHNANEWDECSLTVIKNDPTSLQLLDESGDARHVRVPIMRLIINDSLLDGFLDTDSTCT